MITRLALRARVATVILMLVVMAGGAYSLTRLKLELFPDFDFPVVTISAYYPEAEPQQVLESVTMPVERALQGIGEITTVQTISGPAISQTIIETDFGEDMESLEAEIKRRLERLSLPSGVEPRVARISPDEFPIVEIAVTGGDDIAALAHVVQLQVIPALETLPGVSSAEAPVGIETGVAISRANGRPSVLVSVLKEPDANTVEVANAAIAALEALQPTLPAGTEFIEISNQAPQIERSISQLKEHVLLGSILAVAVIFSFLLSVRPTLVASVSIPVSVLAALAVMWWQGMSLNILTLGALAIGVGRVVDDSIVVMENTFRHIQNGETPRLAALNAVREVAMPITASTLTTIAVFAPLAFIGGFIGVIFLPFALTITFALLASLVVALTIVPVLASLLIRNAREHRDNMLERTYTCLVRSALNHRLLTIGAGAGFTVLGLLLLPFIPLSFVPSGGEEVLSVQMSVPGAMEREDVLDQLDELEAVLAKLRDEGALVAYSSTYGNTGLFTGNPRVNQANLLVRLAPDADTEILTETLLRDLSGPGREVSVSAVAGGGPQSDALELVLRGDDYGVLTQAAIGLTARIREIEGVVNVENDAVDASGPSGLNALLPIVRVDGRRAVTISGAITEKNTQAVNREVDRILRENPLPEGVEQKTGGVFADIDRTFRQMGMAMLFGVALVYAVMVITQRSFVTPFIIILSLPLAATGAMGALFITQRALGLPALIGLLMLIGLVVINAIVLVSFIEQLRARGLGMLEAIVEGGRIRMRPILMTALTTSFVLLPLALGFGGKSAGLIGAELATVVIGGLLASTLLTLVVVPVAYSFLRKKGPRSVARGATIEADVIADSAVRLQPGDGTD